MPRGGKREKAGRKTTWQSGVKFEDTSPIRVPNHVKEKVLEIAHRLDAGEDIDLVINSKVREIEEVKSKILLIDLEKQQISEQAEKLSSDLVTESKKFQLKVKELEEENCRLQNLVENQIVPNFHSSQFTDLLSQFIEKWKKRTNGLPPLDIAAKTHQILSELQKMIKDEKLNNEIDTNSKTDVSFTVFESVTISKESSPEIVTDSKEHTQLDLLDIKVNSESQDINPLTAAELSKRFNEKVDFIKRKKYQFKNNSDKFLMLLKTKDPQGIEWYFSDVDQKYHPVIKLEISAD